MDIKIGQSQALSNMNSQMMDIQRIQSAQKVNQSQNNISSGSSSSNITPEQLNEAVKDLNKKLDMLNSQLKIETDDETGVRVVKIIDKNSKEVIRQIPPETVLKIAKYLDEVAGLIFDTKV